MKQETILDPNDTDCFCTNIDVYSYVYQYKDHLGNIRLSYADSNNNNTIENNEII